MKFSTSIGQDFKALAEIDPSILTERHWTGEEMRQLAHRIGWDRRRVRRVFSRRIWNRTWYLTKSLDPAFEPKEDARLIAQRMLEQRANPPAPVLPLPEPPPVKTAPPPPRRRTMRLDRYSFEEA